MLLRGLDLAPVGIVMYLVVLTFSLTIHEFCHAWVAYLRGDDTARLLGRLTLNPIAHFDIFGTLMILFAPIGWAKPVPVNPARLKFPSRDMMWVSAAGPGSNLVVAISAGLVLRVLTAMNGNLVSVALSAETVTPLTAVIGILCIAVIMNLSLAVFNLLPFFPLDGSRIAEYYLPVEWHNRYSAMKPYMPMILMAVMFGTSFFSWLLQSAFGVFCAPITGYSLRELSGMFGLVAR